MNCLRIFIVFSKTGGFQKKAIHFINNICLTIGLCVIRTQMLTIFVYDYCHDSKSTPVNKTNGGSATLTTAAATKRTVIEIKSKERLSTLRINFWSNVDEVLVCGLTHQAWYPHDQTRTLQDVLQHELAAIEHKPSLPSTYFDTFFNSSSTPSGGSSSSSSSKKNREITFRRYPVSCIFVLMLGVTTLSSMSSPSNLSSSLSSSSASSPSSSAISSSFTPIRHEPWRNGRKFAFPKTVKYLKESPTSPLSVSKRFPHQLGSSTRLYLTTSTYSKLHFHKKWIDPLMHQSISEIYDAWLRDEVTFETDGLPMFIIESFSEKSVTSSTNTTKTTMMTRIIPKSCSSRRQMWIIIGIMCLFLVLTIVYLISFDPCINPFRANCGEPSYSVMCSAFI